ncbi:Ig-like domain-containing protein [Brevibacillus sp. H7]|uniref:Ig-like domain-containing protein n=1 Tax=Brevibacillus sp. H7 TaxID=3349138 RepID=UPI0038149769
MGTGHAYGESSVSIKIPQLGKSAGKIYVTITSFGKNESARTEKSYPAEISEGKAVKSLFVTKTNVQLQPNEDVQLELKAVFTDGSEENVTALAEWSSANEQVATVKDGKVTAHGIGTTKITAGYGNKTVTVTVKVAAVTKVVKSLTVTKTKVALKPNDQIQLGLLAKLSDGTKEDVTTKAEWSSTNEQVATVENGTIKAHGFGKTTITASYGGKTVKVTVEVAVKSLKPSVNKLSLKPGDSKEIVVMAVFGDGSKADVSDLAQWKSSNESVAAYADGKIVANGFGKATITITYGGKTIKLSVDVTLKKLSADPAKMTMGVHESQTVKITAVYGDKSTEQITDGIKWASSNEKIASVDEDGVITAHKAGRAKIMATYGGKTVTISITVK